MFHERTGRGSKLLVAVGLAAFLAAMYKPLTNDNQNDLFVYRAGAKVALEGQSPYNTKLIQWEVAKSFPPEDEKSLANNCGFFLSPEAIVVFAPFTKKEWDTAQTFWFFISTMLGIVCGTLAWTFGRDPARRGIGWAFLVLVVLLNPLTQGTLVVGQTSVFVVGILALGQYCFENDSPRFGCFLWSLAFIKPHLAIPFLALALLLGGWKRAAGIVLFVAIFNLLGGLLTRGDIEGSINLFREYVDYLGSGHKAVIFNLVEYNYQITSWNRMLAACGGPAIDLSIWMILGGYALWAASIAALLRLRGPLERERLSQSFLVAATAVAPVFLAQVLPNEMLLLILLAPLVFRLFDENRRSDAYALLAIIVFLLLPETLMDRIGASFGFAEESIGRTLLRSHKCFGMAALALTLLIRAPRWGLKSQAATATL